MRKVTLPNQFLAEAARALADGETVKIQITGESMYPFIRSGRDTVEIVPCPPEGELPAWCCPFYQWGGNYMIHRYIGSEGSDCLMLGDGNVARIERHRACAPCRNHRPPATHLPRRRLGAGLYRPPLAPSGAMVVPAEAAPEVAVAVPQTNYKVLTPFTR